MKKNMWIVILILTYCFSSFGQESECFKVKGNTLKKFDFNNCPGVENMIVPDGIEVIGNRAFSHYKAVIKTVKLPDSLKIIRPAAFYGLDLKSIQIPSSVEEIDSYAFSRTSITEVNLSPKVIIDGTTFDPDVNLRSSAHSQGTVMAHEIIASDKIKIWIRGDVAKAIYNNLTDDIYSREGLPLPPIRNYAFKGGKNILCEKIRYSFDKEHSYNCRIDVFSDGST